MSPTALCPDPDVWQISWIALSPDRIIMHLEPVRRAVPCPLCGILSKRVHSHYRRRAWDLPWCKWPVQLIVYTRRFFCDTPECPRRIFAEPFPEILLPHARQTQRLRVTLLELAHASNAEMAARVAKLLGFCTSPDTLIRQQREESFSLSSPSQVLGIDEFALRRGSTYATLIVDLERHRPIDVVEDRKAAPVAQWLTVHPETKVIARDRAEAYALAGRTGAPQAIQVADRFHLVHNVGDALRELAQSRRWRAAEVPIHQDSPPARTALSSTTTGEETPERQPTSIRTQKWEAVHKLREEGQSMKRIARELHMNHRIVRKYLALDYPPVYGPRRPQATKLSNHLAYIQERWNQGCRSVQQLYDELVQHGYNGSRSRLYDVVHLWRPSPAPSSAPSPKPPSLSHWLLLRPSQQLTSSEKEELEQVLQVNPPLALGYRLKESFHKLVANRNIAELDHWLEEAAHSDLPPFKTLARTFRQDYEAVKAALILPWSTAQCEGQNTRVKLIKRLGYGRAKTDLLRQRILHRFPVN